MKRFLTGLIVGFILATTSAAVAAQSIKVFVNGNEVKSDVPAQIINGRTMLPVRAISEALDAEVTWEEATRTVYITTTGEEANTIPETSAGNSVIAPTNVTLTIIDVEHPPGTRFEKPRSGYEYLLVHIKLENNSNTKVSYNPLFFGIKDGKGNITNKDFSTMDSDTALGFGELAPGGEVSGTLLFQVPAGDTNLTLIYEYNWLGNEVSIKIPQ